MFLNKKNHQQRKSHHRLYVLAATLPLLIILIPAVYLGLRYAQPTKAAWYDENFLYRKTLSITHNASVSDTQVKFDIDTATEITAGRMQSDCGDSRFVDSTGRQLPYYIDTAGGACNGASTDYYVNIPSLISGTVYIYHYYGNPSAVNGTEGLPLTTTLTSPSGGAATAGSLESAPSPKGWWAFEDMTGTTASDSTSPNNDGTITEATWRTPDQCVVGGCLKFDGSNDVVTITQVNKINFSDQLSAGFTIEAWIRPNGAGEGTGGQVFFKGTNSWLKVASLSGGKLDLSASLDLATTDATVTASASVTNNQWTHVAMTYTDDGDDEVTLWVNGKSVGASTNGVGSLATDANNLLIGGTTTNNFQGFIDEFKLILGERTSTQIMADALIGSGFQNNVSTSFGNNPGKDLTSALSLWLQMDETAANSCTGGTNDSCDSSGNVNDAAWNGGATATITLAKFNLSTTYDGTGDYGSISDSASLSPTLSVSLAAWVYPSTSIATKAIMVKDGSYRMVTDASGNPLCQVHNGTSWQTAATSSTALSLSSWQHVTCTFDGATTAVYVNGAQTGTSAVSVSIADNANALRIGSDAGGTYGDYNGKMDDARVYTRALTSREVRQLYAWTPPPTGWWKMDEGTGTSTTADSSGNGFTGNFQNGPTWFAGKFGTSLDMRRSGSIFPSFYVSETDQLDLGDGSAVTVSAWVYPDNVSVVGTIAAKWNCCTSAGWWFYIDTGVLGFQAMDGTDTYTMEATTPVLTGTWHHVAATFDRNSSSATALYIDGVKQSLSTTGTLSNINSMDSTTPFTIGKHGGSASDFNGFDGRIDDFRFYRYAKTNSQILEDLKGNLPSGNELSMPAPVGWWKLDEYKNSISGDAVVKGDEHNLDVINSPTMNASGKSGSAMTFNGSSQYASTGDSTDLSLTGSLSLSAWIKPAAVTAATRFPIAGKTTTSTISYLLEQYGDEIRMYIGSSSNYATTNSANLATSTWYHVVGVYDATTATVTIYVNGRSYATTVTGTIPSSISDSANGFAIGSDNGSTSYYITADADDGTETADTTWTASPSNAEDAFGFYSGVYNNVIYGARFQSLTIANAATINAAKLTIYSYVSTVGNLWKGRIYGDNVNSAAAFSGTNRPSTVNFTNTTASSDWNPIVWTNTPIFRDSPSIKAIVQEIVNRAGWASGNNMRFAIKNNGTTGANIASIYDYDGTNSTGLHSGRLTLNINSGSANYYNGTLDEVKVYSTPLNQEQILIDYNANSSAAFSLSTNEESNTATGLGNLPVGWWKMDENQGATSTYDSSGNGNDLTMNNMDIFQAWSPGKYGSSVNLDGSNDTLSRADDSDFDFAAAANFTVETWVKHSGAIATNPDYILTKADTTNGGYKLYMDSTGNFCFAIDDDATWTPDDSACSSGTDYSNDGKWHHVVGVKTGTTSIAVYVDGVQKASDATIAATGTLANTNALYIGADRDGTSNVWIGWVDETRIYNYARSQDQISYDYNRGGPVGWWKFDECQNTTANDSSGNSNNGTITIGATGTYTSAGTCISGTSTHAWYGGVSGKFNSGLALDGTNDQATVTDNALADFGASQDFTISVWVKTSQAAASGEYPAIVSKDSGGGSATGYNIALHDQNSDARWYGQIRVSGVNYTAYGRSDVADGSWHHLILQRSGSNVITYQDGKLANTTSAVTTSIANAIDLHFGFTNFGSPFDYYFNGQLDDARIYYYALSATQIAQLYNGGADRFGPATGSP